MLTQHQSTHFCGNVDACFKLRSRTWRLGLIHMSLTSSPGAGPLSRWAAHSWLL